MSSLLSPPVPSLGGALERFHPAVRTWFERRFPGGPTEAQAGGWPAIAAGRDALVCAPTGSGKTLAGFLAASTRSIARTMRASGSRALPVWST